MAPVPATAAAASESIIEARNIRKCFGPVNVLDGVTLRLAAGQIHALLGQNGAGKSTLVKILTGVHPAGSFQGSVCLAGRSVAFHSPADAKRRGVAYVPQEVRLFDELSIAENISLGRSDRSHRVLFDRAEAAERARILFQALDHDIDPCRVAGLLGAADRQHVAIARALAESARVIVLDEPTTSLSQAEVDVLMKVLSRVAKRGTAILYVTHRLVEVRELCDVSTVLRDGKVVLTMVRDSFDQGKIVEAMTGRPLAEATSQRPVNVEQPVMLEVRDLSVEPSFSRRCVEDVSFTVRRGEILGICGLLGSGRTELLHAIFGRIPYAGVIHVDGKRVHIASPRDARACGIALLTEERQRDGLLFNLPVGENVTVGTLSRFSSYGVVRRLREKQYVVDAVAKLRIKTQGADGPVQNLSGGNQQKLLMARVLSTAPRVLLLDEPTKGIDVAVKREIYDLVRELAGTGVSVVLVSSDLDEIFQVATRCLTLSNGRVIDCFPAEMGSQHRVFDAIARDLGGEEAPVCATRQ